MYDIVIIGAGPAGLSAAIYALRAGKSALVLDEKGYGGQIVNTPEVENYPGIKQVSGIEFAANLYEQAKSLGAEVKTERVTGVADADSSVKIVNTGSGFYECKAVIIATGAKNRVLGFDGEVRLTGSGVSYCATCDGNFFRGRDVAVIGGGNTALEDAEVLSGIANKVYLVHRRDAFRGDQSTVDRLIAKENLEMVLDSVPVKVVGDMEVIDAESGERLGVLADVMTDRPQDIYVVKLNDGGQCLIPAVDEFIKGIDGEARQIRVTLIEGMIEGMN